MRDGDDARTAPLLALADAAVEQLVVAVETGFEIAEAVEALYQGLASRPGDGPKFDLDSFEKYLARQVAALREKTGCDQVQFRLAEEDGKLKLKARPVPRTGS